LEHFGKLVQINIGGRIESMEFSFGYLGCTKVPVYLQSHDCISYFCNLVVGDPVKTEEKLVSFSSLVECRKNSLFFNHIPLVNYQR
jgi:hypothetical protein